MKDRRSQVQTSEEQLYKDNNLKTKIQQERRLDELDRLIEVREQKKVWRNVMLICGALNLVLIGFAIVGYMQNV